MAGHKRAKKLIYLKCLTYLVTFGFSLINLTKCFFLTIVRTKLYLSDEKLQ